MSQPARIAFVFAVLAAALLLLSAAAPAWAQEPVPPATVFQDGDKGGAVPVSDGALSGQRGAGLFDFAGFIENIKNAVPEGNTVSYSVTTPDGATHTQTLNGLEPLSLSFAGTGTSVYLNASTLGGASAASSIRQSIR